MAEIRVFHANGFLCRAICPDLAGETIALREILQARNHRRKTLRHILQERARTVEALLEAHRGYQPIDECAAAHSTTPPTQKDAAREQAPKLKRYRHE
jgi:putative transposase